MAGVPITVVGLLTTENGTVNATLTGVAGIPGLGVGGGPIFPDKPPGTPEHPIAGPPDHIWGPTDPRPENPIVLPPEPELPPDVPPSGPPSTVLKDAPEGGWGYFTNAQGQTYSAYNPPEGAAGPKR